MTDLPKSVGMNRTNEVLSLRKLAIQNIIVYICGNKFIQTHISFTEFISSQLISLQKVSGASVLIEIKVQIFILTTFVLLASRLIKCKDLEIRKASLSHTVSI